LGNDELGKITYFEQIFLNTKISNICSLKFICKKFSRFNSMHSLQFSLEPIIIIIIIIIII